MGEHVERIKKYYTCDRCRAEFDPSKQMRTDNITYEFSEQPVKKHIDSVGSGKLGALFRKFIYQSAIYTPPIRKGEDVRDCYPRVLQCRVYFCDDCWTLFDVRFMQGRLIECLPGREGQ